MKKYTIKKLVFGLAVTSVLGMTSGCKKSETNEAMVLNTTDGVDTNSYNDEISFYSTDDKVKYKGNVYSTAYDPKLDYIINEYSGVSYDNGLDTDSLFFVRIDDEIYLATKMIDKTDTNIISKYYAIDTGNFLGQTLDINWYSRSVSKAKDEIQKGKEYICEIDTSLFDQNYFNGEYGLGKNIFSGSIINASSIFKDKKLTKQQIEELLNDQLLVASYVEKFKYPGMVPFSREDYTFIPVKRTDGTGLFTFGHTLGFRVENSYDYNHMQKFSIEDENETKNIVGYRASISNTDCGYNYVYDISSSSFVDISKYKVLDIENINCSNETVGDIRKTIENTLIDSYYIDELNVISTTNLEGDDVFENYYIAMRGEYALESTYKFNVLGDNEPIALSGTYDGSSLCIAKESFYKTTPVGDYNGMMLSLEKCLIDNGMSDLVKDTYTEEQLTLLLNKIRSKKLNFSESNNYINGKCEKTKLEDIIVVDTYKESGNSVLVDSDKRYYILMPYEVTENYKMYITCDNENALCALSLENNYIKIDNIGKTYYWVCKFEDKLECISTLKSTLKKNDLDKFIRKEYTSIDLNMLSDRINEKTKKLVLK